MCRKPFVHLHNHTEYSLLDGAARIPDMVRRAGELGMPAIAITDHGAMFGCMEFYFECVKQGVKPILGMEAYVAPKGRHVKQGSEEKQTYHLLLLAKDQEGYRNLCRLHSIAALEGYYYRPRIDHDALRTHAKGLIGSTTCIGSEVNQLLLAGEYDEAQYRAGMYKEIFDEGCFFVELQDHGIAQQKRMNEGLIRIARELDLPLVATNDAHYTCHRDSEPHDVLLCIGMGKLREDKDRIRFTGQEYIKTAEEMAALFPEHPEALENALSFAAMCDVHVGKARNLMPEPEMPDGATPTGYLRELAEKGLQDRVENVDSRAWERLEYELGVIERTGFDSYFLLVREFANFTREQGIMFGVRGSAAGSLVSYALGITDVNPIEYDLTFERFLNPERVSMPDIDMDFEDEHRDEVIRWVQRRYGEDRVAQIVTFGTLGAKAAIKDAGRVMGFSPSETDRLCKLLPNRTGLTLVKAMDDPGKEADDEAKRWYAECAPFREALRDPRVRTLAETARSIEGLSRHCGVHAAGVVISNKPLRDIVPLYRSNDGQPVTAYEMGILEKIGLLKMDFLGLSNLTVLSKTVELIRRTRPSTPRSRFEETLETSDIPLDDQKTYEMLARGETVGVFQLESGGMRRSVVELKPQSIRELAAMVALYRPGPMEHIPTFVDSKFGRRRPTYPDERMRPILEETYGVIVYQDQVLKLVQALAGFSLGKADVLRRAMGKKDKAVMDSMHGDFVEGAKANGVDASTAAEVWELLKPFAGYAFNKAHAVCYAMLAYQTAFLKANYPVEYMASLLAVYRDKEDRVTSFIEECRRQKIEVLPPDVNRSEVDFSMEPAGPGMSIRFGLAAIKGVGEGLVKSILEDRAKNGPYTHLYEFAERVRPSGMNRLALEALVKAGALDGFEPNRAKLLENLEGALVFADTRARDRAAGQDSLFGDDATAPLGYPELPETEPLDRSAILQMEKEVMGVYVSDHPLRGYQRQLAAESSHTCSAAREADEGTAVRLAGVIANVREMVTKSRGERMASLSIEDFTGQIDCVVFPATYAKLKGVIEKDRVVRLRGVVAHRERPGSGGEKTVEVTVEELQPIGTPRSLGTDPAATDGTVTVILHRATPSQLERLRDIVRGHPGRYEVVLQVTTQTDLLPIFLVDTVDAREDVVVAIRRTVEGCEVRVFHADRPEDERPDSTEQGPAAAR